MERADVEDAVVTMLDHRGAPCPGGAQPPPPPRGGGGGEKKTGRRPARPHGPAPAEWAASFGFLLPPPPPPGDDGAPPAPPAPGHWVPDERLLCCVTDVARLGAAALRQAHEACQRLGVRRLQLVSRHPVPVQTMPTSRDAAGAEHRIDVLPWPLVLARPLDHDLVPPHRRATAAERARLRPLHHLPSLRADDVVAQYLALRPGDVARIDRHDGSVYWRHVVPALGAAPAPATQAAPPAPTAPVAPVAP